MTALVRIAGKRLKEADKILLRGDLNGNDSRYIYIMSHLHDSADMSSMIDSKKGALPADHAVRAVNPSVHNK